MIFVVDAHGGITKIGASSIYQGSVGASQIILLAPLPASLSVTVGFLLPNGTSTSINLARPANMAEINLQGIMTDTEAKNYNAWVYTMQAEVTEYAGTVIVQFFCYGASTSEMLATFASEFVVHKGVAITLPATPTQTIYDQILTALAQANNRLNTLEGNEILRFVGELPTANINPQAIYFVAQDTTYVAYVYNGNVSAWERINDAIVPISSTAEANADARRLYLLTSNGTEGLYAYIGGELKRILDMRDYTALTQLISNAQSTANNALNKANTAQADATQASTSAANANTVASNAQSTANTANNNASEALSTANEALSKAQEALNSLTSVLTFVGSVTFANLPTPSASTVNDIYNVTDAFTTTSSFVEGSGKTYPAGTNVAIVLYNGAYKYDVLSGFVDLSAYQAKLVSGTNIKTINGTSILGSGNIEVEGTQGEQGVGIANITTGNPVVGSEYTTTPLTITYTDGSTQTINIQADNGADGSNGSDGTSITEVTAGASTESEGYTVTPLAITFSNGNIATVNVMAKNGADGVDITSVTTGTPTQNTLEQTVTPLVFTFSDGTTQTVNVAVYNGKDGASIESISSGTPTQGTGTKAGYTATPLSFYKSSSSWITATAWAKNGEEGVGISSVTAGEATESDGYTSTPITVTKTDNTTDTFNVLAKNGADSEGGGIPTLTTQTVYIADLEDGVYLWDYEGQKLIMRGSASYPVEGNPLLLQVSTVTGLWEIKRFLVFSTGSLKVVFGEYKPSDGTGTTQDRSLSNIPIMPESNLVTTTTAQTIVGNKTFTGAVDFSGATVTGISSGSTKTKITLAEFRERLADYTNHIGDLIQVVYKGSNSTCKLIIAHLGLLTINSSTINKTVGSTTASQFAIFGTNDVIYISSSSAYIKRNTWDFNIQNSVANSLNGTNYNITDAYYEFYIIGD